MKKELVRRYFPSSVCLFVFICVRMCEGEARGGGGNIDDLNGRAGSRQRRGAERIGVEGFGREEARRESPFRASTEKRRGENRRFARLQSKEREQYRILTCNRLVLPFGCTVETPLWYRLDCFYERSIRTAVGAKLRDGTLFQPTSPQNEHRQTSGGEAKTTKPRRSAPGVYILVTQPLTPLRPLFES